ncbi:DNA internalization-related competence protein ComEC/Rec2 [Peptococcaceae bacterium 1198_IL3148]
MTSRPLLQLCIVFTIGVLIGSFFTVPLAPMLALMAVVLVVTACCFFKAADLTRWLLVLLCLLLGVFHINMWDHWHQTNLVKYGDQMVTITGAVVREPDVRPDRVIYQVEVSQLQVQEQRKSAQGLLRLTVYQPQQIFRYGDIIESQGQLQTPSSPGNPGQFDYQQYLTRHGIQVIMSVWQQENVKRLGQVDTGIMGWALVAKEHLLKVLAKTLPAEQAALVQGILFGNQGMIDEDICADFQTTSLYHILSVSGFHIALVLGAIVFLLHILKVPLKLQAPLSTMAVIFYAAITGFVPTVVRAVVMGLMVVWARHFGRERDWPTAMALAVVIILFDAPRAMWEAGFQLSFVVTWGILYLTPTVEKMLSRWPRMLVVAVSVPVVAEITAIPLVAYHFNMMSLVGVVTNILTAPIITGVMLFSSISVLVGLLFAPLAAIINVTTGVLLDLLLWLVHGMAGLPHAALYLPSPPWWGVVLFYLLLACLPYFSLSKINIPQYLLGAGVIVSLVVIVLLARIDNHYLTVHFIDVGQGDAALIQTPGNKNMLIDTGGWTGEFVDGSGAGDMVVLPYLKRLGINNLDVLMLSHPHEDHCGGARTIIDNMPVGLVLTTPLANSADRQGEVVEEAYSHLLEYMHQSGLAVLSAKAGQGLQLDNNLTVTILSPAAAQQNLNNGSLVVKISYQQASFLFTGDIEGDQQQILVNTNNNLKADVLKVPHHGSGNFAPEFLAAVNPKIAVISVGEKNRFGHPAPAVLEVLTDMGTKIYRTDVHGAVIINTDGQSIWVDTGRKGE